MLIWTKSDRQSFRKKIPSIWLHVSESLVDQPHEVAGFWSVELEFIRPRLVVSHDSLVYVISSRFWNFDGRSTFCERSVGDDVLSFVIVVWVVDVVEHHLMEDHFFRVHYSVDQSFGKKVSAGYCQWTSKIEVLVQEL
jgi:hypothetical protein